MNENQEQNIEKIREDFVANASHELKTPITSIQLAAETALNAINDGNTEDGLKFIKQILRNSERMSLLISDLLDLSKIEQNEPNLEIADLENILNMEISYLTENDQARLNANIENIHINVDQEDFALIVRNILRNAVTYSDPDTPIEVHLKKDDEDVLFKVIDKGKGISQQDQERIFERFYRIDKGRSRNLGGTGIGLSIVKHAVDRNNGTIELDSLLGEGTTFSIKFKQNV